VPDVVELIRRVLCGTLKSNNIETKSEHRYIQRGRPPYDERWLNSVDDTAALHGTELLSLALQSHGKWRYSSKMFAIARVLKYSEGQCVLLWKLTMRRWSICNFIPKGIIQESPLRCHEECLHSDEDFALSHTVGTLKWIPEGNSNSICVPMGLLQNRIKWNYSDGSSGISSKVTIRRIQTQCLYSHCSEAVPRTGNTNIYRRKIYITSSGVIQLVPLQYREV